MTSSENNLSEETSHSTSSHDDHYPIDFGVGCFILSLALGVLTISQLTHRLHIPYTVLILCFGMLFGLIWNDVDSLGPSLEDSMQRWIDIDPEIILFTMLPILIFESSFSTCVHTFEREFWQIFTLAGPGVLLSSFLTACFARIFFYGWSWYVCLMFGAMLSATDPVAVVALLKELGVSERLATLIEGESLLNDGTSIVVFNVFLRASTSHQLASASYIIANGVRLSLGGPAVGLLIGGIGAWSVGYVVNNPQAETALTLVVCLGAFVVAEGTEIHVSGILSVVMAGLVFSYYGNSRISISAFHSVHSFWETCGYVANTVIFFISGLIMAVRAFSYDEYVDLKDWGLLLFLYVALHIIRAITVMVSFPVLKYKGYGVTMKQATVLAYGGLRGAVGLTLALIVDGSALEESIRARILFHTAGVAFLTLVINGTSMKSVLHWLNLDKSNRAETDIFIRACSVIEKKLDVEMSNLKRNPHLADADWLMVMRYIPVLTSKVYWHRIRHGTVELSKEELRDIVGVDRRGWWHALFNFFSPGWHYSELPQRLRSSWYNLHRCFMVDYGDQLATILEDHATNTNSKALEAVLNPVTVRIKGAVHAVKILHRLPRSRRPSFKSPTPSPPGEKKDGQESAETSVNKMVGLISPAPASQEKFIVSGFPFSKPRCDKVFDIQEAGMLAKSSQDDLYNMDDSAQNQPRHNSLSDDEDSEISHSGMYCMERVNKLRKEHEKMISSVKKVQEELNLAVRELASIASEQKEGPSYHTLQHQTGVNSKETLIFQSLTKENASRMRSIRKRKGANGESSNDRLLTIQETRSDTDFLVSLLKPDQAEELHEARTRFMAAVKSNYLTLFRQGFVSSGLLRSLKGNAEIQMDDETKPISCWAGLYHQFSVPEWVAKTAKRMRSIPLLNSVFNSILARHITELFDVTTTFITAMENIKTIELIPRGPACNILISEKVDQLKLANATLENVLPAFPEIVRSLKTRTAARVLLTKHSDICNDLAKQGFISEKEHETLVESNTKMHAYLASHPISEHLPKLKGLAKKVNFLRYLSEEQAEQIITNSDACHEEFHAANVHLLEKGSRTSLINTGREGWYFIVRGCVCASEAIDFQHSLKDDPDLNKNKSESRYRILHTGTPFGMKSTLLNVPYSDNYTTSSFVHAIFFDKVEMLKLAAKMPALNRGIWLVVGVNLLYNHHDFKNIPLKSLYRILHYSFYVDSQVQDEAELDEILKPRRKSSVPNVTQFESVLMAEKQRRASTRNISALLNAKRKSKDAAVHPLDKASVGTPKTPKGRKSLASAFKTPLSGQTKERTRDSQPCLSEDHQVLVHRRAANGGLLVEVHPGDLVFVLQGRVSTRTGSGKWNTVTKLTPAYLWDLQGEVDFAPHSIAFIIPHEVLEWANIEAHEYHTDQVTDMSLDALHVTDIHRSRANMTSTWSHSYYNPEEQFVDQMNHRKEIEQEENVAGSVMRHSRNPSYKLQRTGSKNNGFFMFPHGPKSLDGSRSRSNSCASEEGQQAVSTSCISAKVDQKCEENLDLESLTSSKEDNQML